MIVNQNNEHWYTVIMRPKKKSWEFIVIDSLGRKQNTTPVSFRTNMF
jgi:hypothetical protein